MLASFSHTPKKSTLSISEPAICRFRRAVTAGSWFCFPTLVILLCLALPVNSRGESRSDSLLKCLAASGESEKGEVLLKLSGCYINSDVKTALKYINDATRWASKHNEARFDVLCLIQKGLAYNNLGSYDTAIRFLREALSRQSSLEQPSHRGRLYTSLGIAFENAGHTDSALKYYQHAGQIYQHANHFQGIANTSLNIGCLFSRIKQYDDAERYLQRALEVSLTHRVYESLGSVYNNLGVVNDIRGKKEEALRWYSRALIVQQKQGNRRGMASIYHNRAIIYNQKGEYQKAIENQRLSLQLKQSIGDEEGMANAYSLMADILIGMGHFDEAFFNAQKALNMAEAGGFSIVEADAHRHLADIYRMTNRYKEAVPHLQRFIALNDTLYNERVSRQLSEMQARYEVKQKEQENQILRQRISLQEAQNQSREQSFRLLMIVSVSSAAVLVLLFFLLRLKNKSLLKTRQLLHQELRLKELELAASENDYRLLEAEKHREATAKALLQQKHLAEQLESKLEMERLNSSIVMKNNQLISITANFINQNEVLWQIKKILLTLRKQLDSAVPGSLHDAVQLINNNLDRDLNWKKFGVSFEEAYPGFFDRLLQVAPGLTLNEQKLCAYLLIRLSSREIADVMNISLAAVNKNRQRLRKHLNLEPEADLSAYLGTL